VKPQFQPGQKIKISPVSGSAQGPRDSTLEQYAGQIGEVINYYWISPRFGEVFCIYAVRVSPSNDEIVLHEDEIEENH